LHERLRPHRSRVTGGAFTRQRRRG
jgi:hypothetical protein